MAVWVCTDDDSEDELSVEEDKDAEVNNTATAAAAAAAAEDDDDDDDDDSDDDDAEYFEDVSDSVPTLAELRQQIVSEIGEPQFRHVYDVLQVTHVRLIALLVSLLQRAESEIDLFCANESFRVLMPLVAQQEGPQRVKFTSCFVGSGPTGSNSRNVGGLTNIESSHTQWRRGKGAVALPP